MFVNHLLVLNQTLMLNPILSGGGGKNALPHGHKEIFENFYNLIFCISDLQPIIYQL